MRCDHNIDAGSDCLVTGFQKLGKLFPNVGIAFTITKILDALYVILFQDVIDAQLFRPVCCIDDQGFQSQIFFVSNDFVYCIQKIFPR